MPVFNANSTAVSTRRASLGDLPPSGDGSYSGNNCSISFHIVR